MKQIIISILLAVMALPLMAANANIDKANQAYKQELYNEALQLYLQEAKETGVSSALYCNIGDTYYRLKDNVHAVLYYERALVLDPSNSDARFNLDFVRGKMQLPDDAGDSWFSNWVDQTVSRLSSNAWAKSASLVVPYCWWQPFLLIWRHFMSITRRQAATLPSSCPRASS